MDRELTTADFAGVRKRLDLYDELARYVLRSSAWSEEEIESLTDAIHDAIGTWLDAHIIEDAE